MHNPLRHPRSPLGYLARLCTISRVAFRRKEVRRRRRRRGRRKAERRQRRVPKAVSALGYKLLGFGFESQRSECDFSSTHQKWKKNRYTPSATASTVRATITPDMRPSSNNNSLTDYTTPQGQKFPGIVDNYSIEFHSRTRYSLWTFNEITEVPSRNRAQQPSVVNFNFVSPLPKIQFIIGGNRSRMN